MHETYLNNEREFEEKFVVGTSQGLNKAMTTGAIHDFEMNKIKSHNRLSLIKVMKALVDELEAMKHDDGIGWSDEIQAYNQALQLAINKINNFINKIQ